MANPDRLSALDCAFLHIEDHSPAHMHIASVMIFDGKAPSYAQLVEHILSRLHLVPRYRQRLAFVPLNQGRPVWSSDPRFNPYYHIRETALPRPADEHALQRLAGRIFSQRLDRTKPLWEMWLVQRLAGNRFALIAKAHHALVDGISGVDITTVLLEREPTAPGRSRPALPFSAPPPPSAAKLLSDALIERATMPKEIVRGVRASVRGPRRAMRTLEQSVLSVAASALPGLQEPAPASPFNVHIGPHRRYTWVKADLQRFKAIKDSLGGTLNDVVISAVALALGSYLRAHGHDTEKLVLKAMIPVSVRAEAERGALGNRVAAMWAPLPVGVRDPAQCHREVCAATSELKSGRQAIGAQVLSSLAGFAPPTILSQAARLQARQRYFNLVITNVPGPQFPLYLLSSRMSAIYPVVPLARAQALAIAALSYDGGLGFGLLADYDAVSDLELIAAELKAAIASLSRSAGIVPAGRSARAQ